MSTIAMKQFFSYKCIAAFVLLVCTILDCSVYAAELEIETVECGLYEQDGDLNNGPEPIEWIVLSETEDDMKLLLSKYCLDAMPYDVSMEEYGGEDGMIHPGQEAICINGWGLFKMKHCQISKLVGIEMKQDCHISDIRIL